jgi:hypothetical protein
MILQNRIELLLELKDYLKKNTEDWKQAKASAERQNGWFTEKFIEVAVQNILTEYLQEDKLSAWAKHYHLDDNIGGKNIGIVMAGNLPLVGFHDFLTVFVSGHKQTIKLSGKDNVLLKFFVHKLEEWDEEINKTIQFAEMLRGCDAYIATGSNNTAGYFIQYFGKYPNIIRRNRTSVAVITGNETVEDLENLSDDVHLFFGLGCRNVTKIYVPENYNFEPMIRAFDNYNFFKDHNKFRNNYDYQLSLALLNNIKYMANECTLLIENEAIFSPISQLHYQHVTGSLPGNETLTKNADIQCIVGYENIPFGQAQRPGLFDYADGVDPMQFLLSL